MTLDADVPLLTAAYNALSDNCVYEQDVEVRREGLRVLRALGERLGLEPTADMMVEFAELGDFG